MVPQFEVFQTKKNPPIDQFFKNASFLALENKTPKFLAFWKQIDDDGDLAFLSTCQNIRAVW